MKKRILLCWMSALLVCASFAAFAEGSWPPDASLWESVDGSTATIPLTQAIAGHFGQAGDAPEHNTTPRAYESLCEGSSDLIFVTEPAPEDLAIAREAGVELEVIPVVREGLVFLVNAANPVDHLTVEELRKIYAGHITNWKEVGGLDAGIAAYQRDVRSGSQTVFLHALMGDIPPMEPEKSLVIGSMGELVDQVASYNNATNALGYSMHYYIENMYTSAAIRVLSVDGVAPSTETIASGAYPLRTAYYAVLRKDMPSSHPARRLVAWLLSPEGQRVASDAGYAPLEPAGAVSSSGNSIVKARTINNLATRSGPSTTYRETGTYNVKGEYVRVISLAYDDNDLCWVHCEVVYGNKLRRVYTGLQRFDIAFFTLYDIPVEDLSDRRVKVASTSKAMYGPGDGYDTYGSLTVDKGQTVTIITIENGYAQVEWTTSIQNYRAWVPLGTLEY